jgi:hypothetical protein
VQAKASALSLEALPLLVVADRGDPSRDECVPPPTGELHPL